MLVSSDHSAPSVAFFCPQSKAPSEVYLEQLREYILNHPQLRTFGEAITTLKDTWTVLRQHHRDIASLRQGEQHVTNLERWIREGVAGPVSNSMSGILALPLLVVIELCQYFQFLELRRLTHSQMLSSLKDGGGAQGYCGGLPAAFAIACAKDEEEVVHLATKAMRLALAVGAFGELGDDESIPGPTTIAVRLKTPGQGDELVKDYPGCYISAITDPKTISLVGPVRTLEKLANQARDQGLLVSDIHIRGKVHNPENKPLVQVLCDICEEHDDMKLPNASQLLVPVRSNINGKLLVDCSLTHEAVNTILASRCEWYQLLTELAEDLASKSLKSHSFALFGIGDPVPLMPFHNARLRVSKMDVHTTIQSAKLAEYEYPENAIAITGVACRLPGANDLEELWDLLAAGKSTCEEIRLDRVPMDQSFRALQDEKWTAKQKWFGNFIDGADEFDWAFFRSNPKEAANMDPQQRVLLELTLQAMESAGYLRKHRRENGDRVGCFIGASFIEYTDNTDAHPPTAYTATGTIRAFLCGRISHYFGWTGPAEVIDTACSSSLVAVNRACRAIWSGECPMAVTGGVNIISGVHNYMSLGKAGFLSPTGQCKPFDQSADGYCRADGAGIVVLKPLKQALADGDQVFGVIPGASTNQGGLSATLTVTHSPAQIDLYNSILKGAGMSSSHVSYVEAHGTGTQAGDPLEVSSIREVFGGSDRPTKVHLGSIKSNIGHGEAAAGVAGLVKVLAMLQKKGIPPHAGFNALNPKIPPLAPDRIAISKSLEAWDVPFKAALVNSYGAAGSNAALVCCEGPKKNLKETSLPSNTAYPIILSANTAESLRAYAKALKSHINRGNLDVSNLAFTLSERRKKFPVAWATTTINSANLESQLSSDLRPWSFPTTPKRVVFAFGGQSKQTIGLSKSLYVSNPRLNHYIDECDRILVGLGYPTILPAVFHDSPIADTVVLQTGTMAVQYACAMCWIDAGVQPACTIGHSFGELTALAVSGVLSLENALKLVATRAQLMVEKWGPERGTMLAIFATSDTVQQIVESVGPNALEIACFNAVNSQVVVGTQTAVADAERLLSSDSRFKGVRSQRLDVTHGFHSRFTEPLIEDLAKFAQSLAFKDPSIPIEPCTRARTVSIAPEHLPLHLREPVYFVDAVRRIEERLGGCIWLEAGLDSSIIPMVKRAVATPDIHSFHGIKTTGPVEPTQALAERTIDLWKEGLDITPWPFLSPADAGVQPIWLPPYQFQRTKAWLKNIDRATEMQRSMADLALQKVEAPPLPRPTRLLSHIESDAHTHRFDIDVSASRFRDIISGHAVRGRPLCPASMYMECAAMALQLLGADFSSRSLAFEDVSFDSPLGVNLDRKVIVTLEQNAGNSWKFSLSSTASSDTTSPARKTVHGKGKMSLAEQPRFATYKRLIADRLSAVRTSSNSEKLSGGRAYGLFSKVVDYVDFFQGIKNIIIDQHEAVAEIRMPDSHIGGDESTVTKYCDTVSIDAFIQVSGLLINSSELCPPGQVFVASGLESVTTSSLCDFDKCKDWNVYAIFTAIDDLRATGDVFVLTKNGEVAMTAIGAKFNRLEISKLERTLDGANGSKSTVKPGASPSLTISRPVPVERVPALTPDASSASSSASSVIGEETNDSGASLKRMISTYTGAPIDYIALDTCISDLGVDSLAAVELSDDIYEQFGKAVSPDEILELNFGALCQLTADAPAKVKQVRMPPSAAVLPKAVPSPSFKTGEVKPVNTPSGNSSLVASAPVEYANNDRRAQLFDLISELCGVDVTCIHDGQSLQDLGFDSLSTMELRTGVRDAFDIDLDSAQSLLGLSVKKVMELVGAITTKSNHAPDPQQTSQSTTAHLSFSGKLAGIADPFDSLLAVEASLPDHASSCGYTDYLAKVATRQDDLLLAYIVEGFQKLGVDFKSLEAGQPITTPNYLPKHQKVMQRYYEILQSHNIIQKKGSNYIRSNASCDFSPSSELLSRLIADFPQYSCEAKLMSLTGPKLAECLTGTEDPVALLFGTSESQQIVADFYTKAPMFATLTELLVDFVVHLVQKANGPVRIIEVGAGMGGTTKRLGEVLEALGHPVEYVFTDISQTLVRNASKRFKYPWMKFKTLNLEVEPSPEMLGEFDIAIGTNCVHATTNKTDTCRRIKQLLNPQGLMILSEITSVFDWHEIVLGLLDGWWLANDTSYALQPPEVWMDFLHQAGFPSATYSQSTVPDCNLQRLLVASMREYPEPPRNKALPKSGLDTVVYKRIDEVEIEADVYLPKRVPDGAMPVALMIHGGGHMTLSRKAVRPAQTAFLLSKGILPVSVDYRLCPEVNIIDGPIADVRDAYIWLQNGLPAILSQYGISIDAGHIVCIGWSTGAHLAMSLAWTTKELGIKTPTAILAFYGPTDFESGDLDKHHNEYPARRMRLEKIMNSLPNKPVTNYGAMIDGSGMGWVKPGDPRSELVFALLKEGIGLNVLLNGLSPESLAQKPDPARVRAISPLAHVRDGTYNVPTFVIHGEMDELIPYKTADSFVKELERVGVECGLLRVANVRHIHDLHLKPGSHEWRSQVEPGYRFLFGVLGIDI